MFNSFNSQLAFVGASPAAAPDAPTAKPSVSAMLAGVRGRVVGRGAPPVTVPPTPAAGSQTSGNGSQTSATDAPMAALEPEHAPDEIDLLDALGAMAGAITQMQGCLEAVRTDVAGMRHRNSESERLFDALHAEMLNYKRDFVFEHVKPLLRPLLFVFDALEEFDREMALHQTAQTAQNLAPNALRADKVRDNIAFVRDQFEQALLTCEVELLPTPAGHFDAHGQKAVATVPVAPEQDGLVQSVARPGWTLKGHVLRPTEVVVGKAPKTEGDTP